VRTCICYVVLALEVVTSEHALHVVLIYKI